jgi:hypothetical protein
VALIAYNVLPDITYQMGIVVYAVTSILNASSVVMQILALFVRLVIALQHAIPVFLVISNLMLAL